jgi:hypothetical protein
VHLLGHVLEEVVTSGMRRINASDGSVRSVSVIRNSRSGDDSSDPISHLSFEFGGAFAITHAEETTHVLLDDGL